MNDSTLKLVYCGTPQFAVPTLAEVVRAGYEVALVVTQPDRPRGRGLALTSSPVKQTALDLNLPFVQPEKIKNNDEFRATLAEICPDAIIVVGYGRILPQWMIDLPRLGNINVHASLLPKYRGAAPIQWAIARGETLTGVTTMRIDAGLDTGNVLLQEQTAIDENDTAETISPRLATLGAGLLVMTLRGLQAGTIEPQPQDHAKATQAPVLRKEDGRIDFKLSANEICNRLRGFQPWPGGFTTFREKNLNVWKAIPVERDLPSGEVFAEAGQLFAGCAPGTAISLGEVQPEGKKHMTSRDFIHGYHPSPGERFGE